MARKTIQLDYTPQPKQELLHKCKAKQILFGTDVHLVKLSIVDDNINIRTDKV